MIFATVGTQLPFPRLIDALDRIAASKKTPIFAQTSDPTATPRHIEHRAYIPPAEFTARCTEAELLVGHAGIGTILTAKRLCKPLVIFPRRAALNEHRNDHQAATARQMAGATGIYVAWDETELERLLSAPSLAPAGPDGGGTRAALAARIRQFIIESA